MSFKLKYGEVHTPELIINTLLEQIPIWNNPNLYLSTWLDPCAGQGRFGFILYNKLMKQLKYKFPNEQERSHHILTKMIYMIEINPHNQKHLYQLFPYKHNISIQDFFKAFPSHFPKTFDIIIGNPPYQVNGMKRVPTQCKKINTKPKTIWPDFIRRSIDYLHTKGYLSMIVPAIWLKPDKAKIYHLLTSYSLIHIHTLTNRQTNKLFKGQAQTPTTMFTLYKHHNSSFPIVSHGLPIKEQKQFKIKLNYPIPMCYFSLVEFMERWMKHHRVPSLFNYVYKTNTVPKEYLTDKPTPYLNIHTCIFKQKKKHLVKIYSTQPLQCYSKPKIILAHKMYGCPHLDNEGIYGISSRDNYVIYSTNNYLYAFLKQPILIKLIDTTRYRMSFFEKYCFHWIPYISTQHHLYTLFKDMKKIKIERLHEKYTEPVIFI